MRSWRKVLFGIVVAWCVTASSHSVAQAAVSPNVLLILTDDQGWGDVTSHGNGKIDTPTMDRIAKEGARFDRFYVSPVCAPTRASLMTGRYHLRTGVHGVTRGYETMRSDEVTLAEVLKQAGYATGCFGKWHNGAHYPENPNGQGFDEFLGFCAGHWNNYFNTQLEHNGKMINTTGYMADVLADAAMQFMETNKDHPFFCYVPFNMPHSPFQVADKYFDKYKARGLDNKLACVYGMCEEIDDNIARLLKKLEDLKLAENTIVIFMSDNGPNTERYNGEMKGRKGSVHEGGVRVPFFIRWPGHIQPGSTVPQIASHIDLLPTLVDLCGLPTPKTKPLDGVSLAPLLRGQTNNWPERLIFSHQFRANDVKPAPGSVRSQQYRAANLGKKWELYDMGADPKQEHDLAEQLPDVTKKLSAAYDAWYQDVTKGGFEPIPTKIGYAGWHEVTVQGHEAFLEPANKQGISYNGNAGWANDWIDNWTSTNAYPWWPIEVVEAGRYEITLMYTCARADLGARMQVEIGGQTLEGIVVHAHNPKPLPSPDRDPRDEVYEKVWAPLKLGVVELSKGPTKLIVHALKIPGSEAMELKAVRLRQLN